MQDQIIQEKLKTGTTTVGIRCKGAVVLAAERKASMGYLIASKDAEKIHQIDDHMGMTIAGVVGDAQALIRYIRAELKLYHLNEDRRISLNSAATLISNILYARRFYPYIVQLIIAGYDTVPRIYSLGLDGSSMEEKYFSTGSGSPMAFGLLENSYREDMTLEEAKKLAVSSVYVATQRDMASGGSGIDLAVIDSKGYRRVEDEEVRKLMK